MKKDKEKKSSPYIKFVRISPEAYKILAEKAEYNESLGVVLDRLLKVKREVK